MRIAQVAPLIDLVPPHGYGGTERVVAYLCDALVESGHNVSLFAANGSKTKANLIPVRNCALRFDKPDARHELGANLNMLFEIDKRGDKFDIIHFHTHLIHLPIFSSYRTTTVTTIHTQLNSNDSRSFHAKCVEHPFVGLSQSHLNAMPDINWFGKVYNGIPQDLYSDSVRPENYLAFVGRFSPEKGAHIAIEIAIKMGRKLLLAARIDVDHLGYFETKIRPFLDHPLINYIGEIADSEKEAFLGGATALLFPITWAEPFGLVMIEAMACGTPVVATGLGAVPEIISDGINGVILDLSKDVKSQVNKAESISRKMVRRYFDNRFSSTAMAAGYLDVYKKINSGA